MHSNSKIIATAILLAVGGCDATDFDAAGQTIAASLMPIIPGLPGISASPGAFSGAKPPDTKACRDYLNYARIAGAPGTLCKLTQKYNACLASDPNNAVSRKYQCAPGTYVSYIGPIRRCVKK